MIYYHTTTDKTKLLQGILGPRNFEEHYYGVHPKGIRMFDNIEDAEYYKKLFQKENKLAEIVTLDIPDSVPVHEDKESLGRAFVTDYFDPSWVH